MTVVIRKVKTALQLEYRKAGGVRIQDAVDRAHENLEQLTDQCLARIDMAIGVIADLTKAPDYQPSAAELRQLHTLINEMLACCATVEIPGFVDTLYAVGRLIGALMGTDARLTGTLTPAVNLLRLVRRGAVSPQDIRALIVGVDQCSTRIRAHARSASYQ